jgi:uncharacterized protein
MTMDLDVQRDDARHMYRAGTEGGEAVLAFAEAGPGVLDFRHTQVPEAAQGKGVGDELVRQALEDVRERGLKVIPTCPFVAAYVRRHPEYRDRVTAA